MFLYIKICQYLIKFCQLAPDHCKVTLVEVICTKITFILHPGTPAITRCPQIGR